MRGRLIQRLVCVIRQLDAVATAAVPGGGFDPEFDEPIQVNDGTQAGSSSRREKAALRLPCQVDRQGWGIDLITRGGHEEQSSIILTLHMQDVEDKGLIGSTGAPTIMAGDRIEAIEDLSGVLQESFPDPPGLFVNTVERAGHGLNMAGTPRFNLLILTCGPARQGAP